LIGNTAGIHNPAIKKFLPITGDNLVAVFTILRQEFYEYID